jgi:hypothetical protein
VSPEGAGSAREARGEPGRRRDEPGGCRVSPGLSPGWADGRRPAPAPGCSAQPRPCWPACVICGMCRGPQPSRERRGRDECGAGAHRCTAAPHSSPSWAGAPGLPCRRAAVPPCGRAAVRPCGRGAVGPWGRAAVGPWGRAAVGPWGRAAVGPWGRAAVGPWGRAAVGPCGCNKRTRVIDVHQLRIHPASPSPGGGQGDGGGPERQLSQRAASQGGLRAAEDRRVAGFRGQVQRAA